MVPPIGSMNVLTECKGDQIRIHCLVTNIIYHKFNFNQTYF